MFKTNGTFSRNLERATSNLLLTPDWDAILAICDTLRQGDCAPKPAVEAIKRKLQDKNPHVQLYALQVLDAVVKNCGKPVHDEVMTMVFMDELKEMAKRGSEEARNRVLEVIQCWAHGFRDKPQYRIAQDTVNLMKLEGYKFPVMREADALFVAESAPDWVDGDCCHRCRSDFSLTNRKHHCRNCGQIFCSKCSGKVSPLPHFGIEKEVRVCDSCYDSINGPKTATTSGATGQKEGKENDLPVEYLNSALSKEPQQPVKKTKEEIQEEEELQLALAISQSEAEAAKNKPKQQQTWNSNAAKQEPQRKLSEIAEGLTSHHNSAGSNNHNNGDLDKYLNRQYWEEKKKDGERFESSAISASSQPSAPTPSSTPSTFGGGGSSIPDKSDESYQQNGESDEIHQFISLLKTQISTFTNRMRSNVNRRRPLASDPTVIAQFNTLLPMRQQLMDYIQTQEHWKEYYERIQEKLIRLKEAREALDTLREEHRETKRVEAEERHRMMQMQMVAKLDALRLKKQEYLEYQRQIAFQQMQAQEQELQRRKQMTTYQPYAYVPGALVGPPGRPQMMMGPAAYQSPSGQPPSYSAGGAAGLGGYPMQYQPVHANNAYFPAGQQPPHVPAQYQTQRPSQEYQPQPQQQPGPGQYGMHPQQLGTTHSHSPAGAFQPIGYQGQAAGVYGQQQPVYQTHPQHQTQPQNFYATQGVPATTGALPNDAAVGAPPQQMHPAGVSVGTEEQPLISFD